MEFALKEGWLEYFVSGFLAGLFVCILLIIQELSEVRFNDIVYLLIDFAGSVSIFILGCKVKKKNSIKRKTEECGKDDS